MKRLVPEIALVVVLVTVLSGLEGVFGIRFLLDREECLSHKVEYGANVRFSFVVIKVHGWRETMNVGVDLVVSNLHFYFRFLFYPICCS